MTFMALLKENTTTRSDGPPDLGRGVRLAARQAATPTSPQARSCVLIGGGKLLVECGLLLRSAGVRIQGVVSDDPTVVRWATGLRIPTIGHDIDLVAHLEGVCVDYLFSIVNLRILPTDVIRLPRIAAINCHDGPLPRYAGLHAPSWAIINGEEVYGVTWHLMESTVDAGAIIKQRCFAVAAGETAISLHLKCFEAAVGTLAEMLPDVVRGSVVATAQAPGQRTVYPGSRRPGAGGVLEWHRGGEESDAMARGLDFGPFFNPLLLPKVWTGEDYLVATEVRIEDVEIDAAPGTVLAAHGDHFTVATASRPLRIGGLATLDGEPMTVADACRRHGIRVGCRLPALDRQHTQRLRSASESVARHETFWESRLRELLPGSLVPGRSAAASSGSREVHRQVWHVPVEVEAWVARHADRWQQGEFLLAAFGAFVARIGLLRCFDVEFGDRDGWRAGLPATVADRVPFRFQVGDDFAALLEGVRAEIDRVDRQRTYARDLVPRSPALRDHGGLRHRHKLPLAVELGACGDAPDSGHDLVLSLPHAGREGLAVLSRQLHDDMPCLLERFSDFIRNLATADDTSLDRIALVDDAQRGTLLLEWSGTEDAEGSPDCLHHRFESQAARTPDAVAVQCGSVELTYRDLDARATELAGRLARLGVGPDVLVGICLERSPESLVGVLGILKAGGAYVPLDPAHPQHRLAFIVKDSGVLAIVSTRSLAPRLPPGPALRVYLEDVDMPGAAAAPGAPADLTCRNLAYVIYTSGSTGEPKGVMVEHRSVVNFTRAAQARYRLRSDDRVLQFASINFDASVEEIFPCLASGGTVVLRNDDMLSSAWAFFRQCAAWGITVLDLPTAYWHVLVTQVRETALPSCPGLRLVIVGGEAAAPAHVAAWRDLAGPGIELINTYGPTEATVVSTWANLDACADGADVPIGVPVPGTTAYVLDGCGQPMPIGFVGELHIGGAGLARGYLNRTRLTAEKFVPNPFAAGGDARLYKTGDLCRWRPDGLLEFHGRIDGQVKVRGHRIELGEIESALLSLPGIRQAAVAARELKSGDTRLVAYLVADADEPADPAIRDALARSLPDFMIPAAFVRIESLPINPHGKLDRHALTVPELQRPAVDPPTAPRTPVEQRLAAIWRDLLELDSVGVRDNFFRSGGDSLLSMSLVAAVRDGWGVDLSLRTLFDCPTIESLAEAIAAAVANGETTNSAPLAMFADPAAPGEGVAGALADEPATAAQRGMWLVQSVAADRSVYNESLAFVLPRSVDRERLQWAMSAVMDRHPALRTALVMVDDERLVQRVMPPAAVAVPWSTAKLPGGVEADRDRRLADVFLAEARRPFELSRAPLWRALLVDDGGGESLVLTFHHSIVDAPSLQLFFADLTALYEGQDPAPPRLAVQVMPSPSCAEGHGDRLRDFWRDELRDPPEGPSWPAGTPRPAEATGRGGWHHFTIGADVASRLQSLASAEHTTLFTVMLAACHAWLHRLSGEDDLIVGTPVSTRSGPETQRLMGMMLNTLPIRVRWDDSTGLGDRGFRDVVLRVRDVFLAACDHRDLPFERIVEVAGRGRASSHQPLVRVLFAYLDKPLARWRLGDSVMEPVPVSTGTSKFDLTLSVVSAADGLRCRIEYSTDIFDDALITSFADQFVQLVGGVSADPLAPLSEVSITSPTQARLVTVAWSRSPGAPAPSACLHELFDEQAGRTPDGIALVWPGGAWTYRELQDRSDRLAVRLRGLGVDVDVPVGVCLNRSPELCVALLGILKAGGACLPLDPTLPALRLRFLLADSGCPLVIATRGTEPCLEQAAAAGGAGPARVLLDEDQDPSVATPVTGPLPRLAASPAQLAYVLYTSGSTGQPKGVAMPHRPLVNLLWWQASLSDSAAGRRTLQFASPGFDVAFQEIFSTWLSGGTLVLMPDEVRLDPAALLAAVDHGGIERLFLPTVMLDQLAEAADATTSLPLRLTEVIVAGERLRITAAIRRFFSRLPACRLWNHYGPTETHVATGALLPADAATWPDLPPIGRPVANARVYVLDRRMRPVPPGVAGELWIGGEAIARGYWRRPALSAERFVADPFADEPMARLYRTGDLVRWRMDGELEFLGRTDHQVKIRGHRVELEEIEAILREHPDLQAAAVVVQAAAGTPDALVAFVVGRLRSDPQPAAVRSWLRARLPEPLVPAWITALPMLPLTANGKVDRTALHALAVKGPAVEARVAPNAAPSGQPPIGERETALASLWQSLLGVATVGRHDNFFDLGGNSLLAMRLAARAREALGAETAVRDVFERPTLAALTRHWTPSEVAPERMAAAAAAAPPPGVVLPAATGPLRVPASAAQQRLWFQQQLAPESPVYTIAAAHRVRGALDVDALQAALDGIMARHESLRMTCALVDGRVWATVGETCRWPLSMASVEAATPRHRDAEAGRRIMEAFREPFVLDRGPLVRGCLVRLAVDDHAFVLLMHHIIGDGWSVGLLHRELAACYDAITNGRTPALDPPRMRESDIGAWQGRRLQTPAVADQEARALRRLAGHPALLDLPTDRPRPAVESFRGAIASRTLERGLADRVMAFARREACTPFVVVMTAFLDALGRWSGVDDILVGVPMADRSHAETADLVGVLINMLPVRVDLSGDPPVRGLVARVREAMLEAMSRGDVPFDRLVERLDLRRDLGRSPMFQVMCAWQDDTEEPLRLAGLVVESLPLDGGVSRYDLSLFAAQTAHGIELRLEYATDLFEATTAERLLARITFALAQAMDSPETPLRLLPDGDRPLVVEVFNATGIEFEEGCTVDELFARQVRRTPAAPAVVAEDVSLTYAELGRRAGRVAAWLRGRGVGCGDFVGLSLERSPDMVAAMLGILASGAAYVPFDPWGPVERTAFMVRDCGTRIVLGRRPAAAGWPTEVEVIGLDEVLSAAVEPPGNVSPDAAEADAAAGMRPAYVMYTSGSTGEPKGVVVHHAAVCNFIHAMSDRWPLRPDDAVLQSTNVTFDIAGYEIFGPLLCGARLVLAPAGRPDPRGLAAFIVERAITVAQFVPTMLAALVEQPALSAAVALRTVFCGGEAMPPDLPRRLFERLPVQLVNMYGPTEATIWTTAWPCTARGEDRPPPIGGPLANTTCYVLDGRMQPLPIGGVGELFIGGPQVALGYLKRPALTAERFVADPFGGAPCGRLYRTGDLCSWRADGSLDFHGRLDDQLKIRGHRIEPAEIEAALASHPDVAQAAVVARVQSHAASRAEQVLRACVVPRHDRVLDARQVRASIADRLPEWMVPGEWLTLPAMPLLPNGKIDRRTLAGLPSPDGMPTAGRPDADAADEPRTLLEWEVLSVWKSLFGREDILRTDNFFELGGHSLLAARLAVELERLLGHRVPVAALFQAPTVESLARALADESWLPAWASLVPLQPQGARHPLFLVHGRGGCVYHFVDVARSLAPDQPVYGLQAVRDDDQIRPHDTVPEMAACYVREIRSLQQHGPYHVGGYSLGGWIAYEVARQLQAQGQEVTLLVFDTHANCRMPWPARGVSLVATLWYEIEWAAARCRHHAAQLAGIPPHAWLGYAARKIRLAAHRILRRGTIRTTPADSGGDARALPREMATRDDIDRIVGLYAAGGFTGPVELFVSRSRSAVFLAAIWRCLVRRGLRVHRLACGHHDMFLPTNVPALGAMLRRVIG